MSTLSISGMYCIMVLMLSASIPHIRLNINIKRATQNAIQECAKQEGYTITEAVRTLIRLGYFVWKAHVDGSDVLIRDRNGDIDRMCF